jgi:TRAP-type C4-dicarboxylate transport system substrate-binding protein
MSARRIGILGTALASILLLSAAARAQEVTLSAINFLPHNVDYGAVWMKWIEEVNAAGKGKLTIEVRPFGSIPQMNIGDAVRSGVVDMSNVPPAFYSRLLPWADGIKLATVSHADMHKNGAEAWINEQHNKIGIEYLTTWGWGDTFVWYMRDKPVTSIEGFKGLKVRGTPIYRAFLGALGAEMISTPTSEITSILERGVVDGFGWTSLSIKDQGWSKYVKYRIEPGFYTPNVSIIANLNKWRSLPEDVRNLLKDKAIELATEYPEKYGKAATARARQQVIDEGVEIIELKGAEAETYLKTAQDAGWAEIEKLDPVNGPKLRSLISR